MPFSERCVTESGAASPRITEMTHRGPRIPSNWSAVVRVTGYYRVCMYQALPVDRWCEVEPERRVAFGPYIRWAPLRPTSVDAGHGAAFDMPITGTRHTDAVWLVEEDQTCIGDVVYQYLLLADAQPLWGTAEGSLMTSGNYTVCYRGWPYHLQPPRFVGQLRVHGVATEWVPANSGLVYPNDVVVNRVHGFGLRPDDTIYLSLSSSCSAVNAVGTLLNSHDDVRAVLERNSSHTVVHVAFVPVREGTYHVCYRSAVAGSPVYAIGPTFEVAQFGAESVFPVNASFAARSIVSLNISGYRLNASEDSASLHRDGDCRSAERLPLHFNGTLWVAYGDVGIGLYHVCYATAGAALRRVGSYMVIVQRSFYADAVPAVDEGAWMYSWFHVSLSGWGLSAEHGDRMLLVKGTNCSAVSNHVVPHNVSSGTSLFNLTLAGNLSICLTLRGGRIVKAAEHVVVVPLPPTRVSPNEILAGIPQLLTISGGSGHDLTSGDAVSLCSREPSVIAVVSPSSFLFTAPRAGWYEFCFESGQRLNKGLTTVSSLLRPSVFAAPWGREAAIVPPDTFVLLNVSVTIHGFDLPTTGVVAGCRSNVTVWPSSGSFFIVTSSAPGVFELCYWALPISKPLQLGNVTFHPQVVDFYPSSVYADDATDLSLFGVGLEGVQSYHLAQGSSCAPLYAMLLTPQRNSTNVLRINVAHSGVYSLCFRDGGSPTWRVNRSLIVRPRIVLIAPTERSEFYSQCMNSMMIVGAGIDRHQGTFYVSRGESCSVAAAYLTFPDSASSTRLLFGRVNVDAPGNYWFCFDGAAYGYASANSSISVTHSDVLHTVRYLCPFEMGSTFNFDLARSGGPWIPLDSGRTVPLLAIGALPIRYDLSLRVVVHGPNSFGATNATFADTNATLSLEVRGGPGLCALMPQQFHGSSLMRMAVAAFSIRNYVTLHCQGVSPRSNPTAALLAARNLAALHSHYVSDVVLMLPAFSGVLPFVDDSMALAATLLQAILPVLPPYVAMPRDVLDAHITVASDALSLAAAMSTGSLDEHTVVMESFERLKRVATSMCASGRTDTVSRSAFAMGVTANPARLSRGTVKMSPSLVVELGMDFQSATGFCFAVITTPVNLLNTIVARRRGAEGAFNMPLFVISADPFRPPAPTMQRISVQFEYPAALQPSAPSRAHAQIYQYLGTAWTEDRTAQTVIDIPARSIVVHTSSGSNALVVSGRVSFAPLSSTELLSSATWDPLLVILTLTLCGLALLCLLLGFARDRHVDAHTDMEGAHNRSLLEEAWSVTGYRYYALAKRYAHHPIGSCSRVASILVFVLTAFIGDVIVLRLGDVPEHLMWLYGLGTGLSLIVLATPVSALVRLLLFAQSRDVPTAVAAPVSVALYVALFAATRSFILSGAVAGPVGLLVFTVSSLCVERNMLCRGGLWMRIAGALLTALLAAAALVVGLYVGLTDLLPASLRRERTVLWSILWAVGVDGAVVDPVKHFLIPWLHDWTARRQLRPRNQLPPTARAAHEPYFDDDEEAKSVDQEDDFLSIDGGRTPTHSGQPFGDNKDMEDSFYSVPPSTVQLSRRNHEPLFAPDDDDGTEITATASRGHSM